MDYPSKRRYDEQSTVQVKIKLNKKTDADIIEYLNASGNKQGTIKEALREKMELEVGIDDETLEKIKAVVRECGEKRIQELLELRTKPTGEVN